MINMVLYKAEYPKIFRLPRKYNTYWFASGVSTSKITVIGAQKLTIRRKTYLFLGVSAFFIKGPSSLIPLKFYFLFYSTPFMLQA